MANADDTRSANPTRVCKILMLVGGKKVERDYRWWDRGELLERDGGTGKDRGELRVNVQFSNVHYATNDCHLGYHTGYSVAGCD